MEANGDLKQAIERSSVNEPPSGSHSLPTNDDVMEFPSVTLDNLVDVVQTVDDDDPMLDFDLPASSVNVHQTLEEILNEPDRDILEEVDEDGVSVLGAFGHQHYQSDERLSGDTASSASPAAVLLHASSSEKANTVVVSGGGDNDDEQTTCSGSEYGSVPRSSSASVVHRKSADWKTAVNRRRKASSTAAANLLRFSRIRSISAQLQSAMERVGCGCPTVVTYGEASFASVGGHSRQLIAVGTAHGAVMLFDAVAESLRFSVGTSSNSPRSTTNYGAVSSLSFNKSCSKLLVGYSKGHVHLIDCQKGKTAVHLEPEQAHQAGCGVLQLRFSEHARIGVCLDSGGSVFELQFGTGIAGNTMLSRLTCLFSGCHGEVCAISPLWVPAKLKQISRQYSEACLLAMVSVTKVIVVAMKPHARVVFACPITGALGYAPQLCWQWVPIQVGAGGVNGGGGLRVVEPVLSFCWGDRISLHQLHGGVEGDVWRSFCLLTVQLAFTPISLQWLNSRSLALIDSKERLYLYEVADGKKDNDGRGSMLASITLKDAELVYASSDYKGLATGGNVSEALRSMADHVCYQSTASDNHGTLYVLGVTGLFSVKIRSWLERIDALQARNDLHGALHLALDLYEGDTRPVNGTSSQSGSEHGSRWKEIVKEKATGLLKEFVFASLTADCPKDGPLDALQEHFKHVIPVCVETCRRLGRWDVLYSDVYDLVGADSVAKGLFLECLEEQLLDGILVDLPPMIVQDYLNHLIHEGLMGAVESSIVRLPIESLDLHQVMTLCRRYRLYDGIIYVNNQALSDYITPLEDIFAHLFDVSNNCDVLADEDIQIANKVLLYLSCCLTGRSYPFGALDEEVAVKVANDVFRFITAVHSKQCPNQTYPYLKLLMKFDARDVLNVLSMSFQSDFFNTEDGYEMVQKLLDILLQIVISQSDLTIYQLGAVLTFISRIAVQMEGKVFIGSQRFHQLLEAILCHSRETVGSSSFEERQQAVLELLQSSIGQRLLDKALVLSWAEKGSYLHVCEYLYWDSRAFDKIIDCYLESPFRQAQVFDYLKTLMTNVDLSTAEMSLLKAKVEIELSKLSAVDPSQCARILLEYFPESLNAIVEQLKSENVADTVVILGQNILEIRKSSGCSNVTSDSGLDEQFFDLWVERMCARGNGDEMEEALYVVVRDWEQWAISSTRVLGLCRRANCTRAAVYLLEALGELEEAFVVLEQKLTAESGSQNLELEKFLSAAYACMSFVHRSSTTLSAERLIDMWDIILDRSLSLPPEALRQEQEVKALLTSVVHSLIEFVAPAELIERLFKHEAFRSSTYKEHQELIATIFQGYDYQQVLLSKAVGSVHSDAYARFLHGVRGLGRPFSAPPSVQCHICRRPFAAVRKSVALFLCSHACHTSCLPPDCTTDGLKCPLCDGRITNVVDASLEASASSSSSPFATPARTSVPAADGDELICQRQMHVLDGGANPFHDPDFEPTFFEKDQFPLRLMPPRNV